MLSSLKPKAEATIRPIAKLLKNVDPNIITISGLIFPVLFFLFMIKGWYVLALLAFVFNSVDLLDGVVARYHNKVTAFGGFLDSTIDRFVDFTIIAAFGFAKLVKWELVLPLILLTYLISYIRSRTELASDKKVVASVGLIERTERLVTIFIGLLVYTLLPRIYLFGLNILSITFLILIALSFITVWQRVSFARLKL